MRADTRQHDIDTYGDAIIGYGCGKCGADRGTDPTATCEVCGYNQEFIRVDYEKYGGQRSEG